MPTKQKNTQNQTNKRIVIAGGSGFIGQHLATALVAKGYDVVVLSRQAKRDQKCKPWKVVYWDGANTGDWQHEIDGAYAVINLAGKNVNCRYTQRNLNVVDMSRVLAVTAIAKAINQAASKPRVLIQSSTTAIFGHTGDAWIDETSTAGYDTPGSTIPVATATYWENAFAAHPTPDVRRAILRISFALGPDGGALKTLSTLTRLFLGGRVGSGKQYISWIHINDLIKMFIDIIECDDMHGLYNATSPTPVTNAAFMKQLRRALGRPWAPPTPALLARIGAFFMRTEPVLALTGRRIKPARLLAQGFEFQHKTLDTALADVFG